MIFDQNDKASRRVAFSGGTLLRQSEHRSDDAVLNARADLRSRWMLFAQGRVVLDFSDEAKPAALFSAADLLAFEPLFADGVLLGFQDGKAHCAVSTAHDGEDLPEPFRAVDYRSTVSHGLLGQAELAILAHGAALTAWHANHRFCGKCGAKTVQSAGGAKRVCTACFSEHFPRTDPVAIMLIVRGDMCLLARGVNFPEKMISCLAGFMEPGETLEEAVRRETREETGIATSSVTYYASQPWPFPYSLMIGCFAEAQSNEIILDKDELEMGRWFTKAEVRQLLVSLHPEGWVLPPFGSIARVLIEDWANT